MLGIVTKRSSPNEILQLLIIDRIWFGTRGSEVPILSPRPVFFVLFFQEVAEMPIRPFEPDHRIASANMRQTLGEVDDMTSTQLPWGPREGKILCIIELDLPQDIDRETYSLDDVLRLSIDYCSSSVWKERSLVDPRPPAPKPRKDPFAEIFGARSRNHETNQWHPRVEVIPPTTLFTDPNNPGIRINLALPPEIADELKCQFKQKWQELMADIRQYGVRPFRELYKKPASVLEVAIGSSVPLPIVEPEDPLSRWWPFNRLICYKNAASKISQH